MSDRREGEDEDEDEPVIGGAIIPDYWYRGASGDSIAVFGARPRVLLFHPDGSVTWTKHEKEVSGDE